MKKHNFINFKSFWKSLSLEKKQEFAEKIGSTPGYMKQIYYGYCRPSPKLARTIDVMSYGRVPRSELCPEEFQ